MSPIDNRLLVPRQEPLLLDYAPGAAAAYSLRKLSLSYTGPVVTVRRSSDNAEADFTAAEIDDGTMLGWVGAGVSAYVTTWHDQSGNARNATQTTTGYQPRIVDAGVLETEGGKAAVRFDGTDDRLSFSDIATDSAISTFTVTRRQAAGLRGVILSNVTTAAGTHSAYEYSDNKTYVGNRAGYIVSDSALSEQVMYSTFSPDYSSSVGMALYRNGALLATTTAVLASSVPVNSIGKRGGEYATGTAQEMILYKADMTAQRQRIEGDMAFYY